MAVGNLKVLANNNDNNDDDDDGSDDDDDDDDDYHHHKAWLKCVSATELSDRWRDQRFFNSSLLMFSRH